MQRIKEKRLTQKEAGQDAGDKRPASEAAVSGLSKAEGAKGLISQQRGKPSNHRLDAVDQAGGIGSDEREVCRLWANAGA